jgi:hypothetical protein
MDIEVIMKDEHEITEDIDIVTVPLRGEVLRRFRRFMEREYIEQKAVAGRKLIGERLAQLEEQEGGATA